MYIIVPKLYCFRWVDLLQGGTKKRSLFTEKERKKGKKKQRTVRRVHTSTVRRLFFMNASDRQITVINVAESNSDVLHSRARGPNCTDTSSRVPYGTQFVDVTVQQINVNADDSSSPLCCTLPMGSANRYSSYNCLTSWDSYDRIPR